MPQEKGQQQSIKNHFKPVVVELQEPEKGKENKVYPLFLAKKKSTKKDAELIKRDLKDQPTPTTPTIQNSKPVVAAIEEIGTSTCKKPKAPSIPRPDPFKKLINADNHQFFSEQRKHREIKAAALTNQPEYIVKKPKRLTLKEIERRMTSFYTEAWKSDTCCKSLFDRLSQINHSNKKVPWVEKYRPEIVEGLLGCTSDHKYLRDWLNRLKLKPASTDGDQQKKQFKKKKKKKQPVKQHKKSSNDEDDYDMDWSNEDTFDELFNVMLLVGRHGVGKSAAVYTAAKETSYTIFEINASSRRAGKDITEKIGEMTESHLVRFDAHTTKRKFEGEPIVIRDTVKKKKKVDIADHFKRLLTVSTQEESDKEAEAEAEAKKTKEVEVTPEDVNQEQKKDKNTLQMLFQKAEEMQRELLKNRPKQSLVLLEEVDILYEDDKGFWPAVIDLCQKSRRPIVMTCNDESKIPYESINFQNTIYFEIPTKDSIIPYVHLICLCENYIIEVNDIKYLCELFDFDIRQILNLLQFWLNRSRQGDERTNGHTTFTHLFAYVMGFADLLDSGDFVAFMDRLKGLNEKTLMLCKQYFLNAKKRRGRKPTKADIDSIRRTMNNLAFSDAYIGLTDRQRHQVFDIDQYQNEDTVNGNEVLWKQPRELDHWDLSETIDHTVSGMAIDGVKDPIWRDNLCKWPFYSKELISERAKTTMDCIDRLCPIIIDTPYTKADEEVFMTEYMPAIRSLCKYDQGAAGKGRTQRSRRKIRYIKLDDESRESVSWEPSC